ncbi:bifunctional phosphoribosylaminoimidazolecarboxamide formyltransferase/IMP cyclohydrolase [Bryobacter aggregatus]|uniref:bifunctional phosphoribosylaminoimidazolecarboxamide formyltransferase/IMP cyclohydrolase n=1 Tax=Bryobacter aggregatus TaxID=360054 RepID=UPI0004E2371A|nr:bifunctional phosphoribosylaminoimidazolecarboxamide formyltransferase/IMP cyclohydrolase [Bryobacter aggregatus]
MAKIRRALLSVTDKTGLVDFAKGLTDLGVELISTGGTAKLLREAGLAARDVSEVTEFPEMLDGRVKTIHPRIAAGVLAIREKADHMAAIAEHKIELIDMVVVNLYAFEKTAAKPGVSLEELIENIDIGGPTMIRAAAKNYQDVAVVTRPEDYAALLQELQASDASLSAATHWDLAKKAFSMTAAYDSAITQVLTNLPQAVEMPDRLVINVPLKASLRYGENPHQSAALYASGTVGIANAEQLQGKELSYNNLVDLDAAWQLICEFGQPASAIIKHTNPCGCATATTLAESYRKAFAADPISAFGGVLAFNREVDAETAAEIAKTFIEAIAAPSYDAGALAVLAAKKNLRLLRVAAGGLEEPVVKTITGGYLVQSADRKALVRAEARVVTKVQPTEAQWNALEFAWRVVKHVKSNAIVYAQEGQLIAAGAGQMSRVDSVKFGADKAVLPLAGCVVASDAFFPFPDGLEAAAARGAVAFIQPGGSVKDPDVIAAADRLGIAMVMTGFRHFRH